MSLSPVQRHRARMLAVAAVAVASPSDPVTGDAHQLLLANLVEQKRRLKDIQSIERKIEAKRAFLGEYDDWVDATLANGTGGADPIITTVLVWHIDAGNFDRAIKIAEYCLRHKLELPDTYERSLPVLLIDEFATSYAAGKMAPTADNLATLLRVSELTEQYDAPDQARSKLHRAIAYAAIGKGAGQSDVDLSGMSADLLGFALHHMQRAFALFDQVGVKKDIERIERRLRTIAEQSSPNAPVAPKGDT